MEEIEIIGAIEKEKAAKEGIIETIKGEEAEVVIKETVIEIMTERFGKFIYELL